MQQEKRPKYRKISSWVTQYGNELYGWASFKVTDESVAEDLVQETFISAFQHFDNFKGTSSPKTWLFSILRNKIVDHYRKKAKSSILMDASTEDTTMQWFDDNHRWKKEFRPKAWDSEGENLLDDPEFESTLSNCIGKLPAVWSSCVQLKYLSEKDSVAICQELNITASNLWQILHRAKLHLRNCLEKNWFKA
jgi:RNA polymerase sigma-70 factor (ECF subfamily)